MNKVDQIKSREGDAGGKTAEIGARARLIRKAGGVNEAIAKGLFPGLVQVSLSEALVLGLLRQNVSRYFAIFGHGSTDLAEILRIYETEGVTKTINCRNEVEMAHAATAFRWTYGEVPAVVTSIGPGALQALAGSLTAASNGIGVYHIYGDETTFGEGYNMQQVPKGEQHIYGAMTALMGKSYVLHTPEAIRDALRRGALRVGHPYKAGPFYMMLPINTQPQLLEMNLAAMPQQVCIEKLAPAADEGFERAAEMIKRADKIAIKAGGGTRGHDVAIRQLAERTGAAVILSPGSTGVMPDDHPQNMHVSGSKGSISGNYAMENADLVIVIGSRAVCQADCSGIGYKSAKAVININGDLEDAFHYNNTVALLGDISVVAGRLTAKVDAQRAGARKDWLAACAGRKAEWKAFKQLRYDLETLHDDVWQRPVLTQPAAIKVVSEFAKKVGAAKYFDAGDVQANGFQIVEDDRSGDTFTDTGASYMGFAASAPLAACAAREPRYSISFCGDGSFMMNPQILIDAVEHQVRATVVIFDNRRMAAITGLQNAQYGREFRTNDSVAVDYVQLAGAVAGVKALFGGYDAASLSEALQHAYQHDGLSVVHVPVYAGDDPLGGLGAWGEWNVGNWCDDVQGQWLAQEL